MKTGENAPEVMGSKPDSPEKVYKKTLSDAAEKKIIAASLKRHKIAHDHEEENRENAVNDLKFLNGGDEQWDKGVLDQRKLFKLPVITINRMPVFVAQVVNDLRQNRPAIKVTPKDDQADSVKADIFSGLIRNIEYISMADVAYDHAGEVAVSAGYYGYFRVVTRYSNDDGFNQDILIKPIWNVFNVSMDPFAVEPDNSDCRWAHIEEVMSREAFKERYPDALGQWEAVDGQIQEDWDTEDAVRVAEYFWREEESVEIAQMEDGSTLEMDEVEENNLKPFIARGENGKPRIRKVMRPKIMWCKMTSGEILEGPQRWPGAFIPIVRVDPKVMFIEGKKILSGLIRHAKGAQQYYNYDRSRRAELLALAPKAPFTATMEQIADHLDVWKNANVEPLAILPYTHVEGVPPPQRTMPPDVPQGMIAEGMQSVDDMKATMGIFDASMGNQSNEQSGKAIRSRQRQADKSYFHFSDNLNRAIRCLGAILIDLIPKIYDTERVVRVMGEDGKVGMVMVNQKLGDITLNDLSAGKYDVVVTSGPSYASQRLEEADALLQLIQAVPQTGAAIMDLVVEGMSFPNSDKIADRIRATMPPNVVNPGTPAPPSPQEQLEQAKLKAVTDRTQAEVAKAKLGVQGQQLDLQAKQMQIQSDALALQGQHHNALHDLHMHAAELNQAAIDMRAAQQKALMTAGDREFAHMQTDHQREALDRPPFNNFGRAPGA